MKNREKGSNNVEQMLVERAMWRKKAQEKIAELDLDRKNNEHLKYLPLDAIIFWQYFTPSSVSFSKIRERISDEGIENLSHLPMHTVAWILAMEDEGREVNIDPHRVGVVRQEVDPFLHSVSITIKMPHGQHLGVSPLDPWHERFADLGDQLLTKKEEA